MVCKTLFREGGACQCNGPHLLPDSSSNQQHCSSIAPPSFAPQVVAPATPLDAPCPPLLPRLDDLLAAAIPTIRHIPNMCRSNVAASLTTLLGAFVSHKSWEALHKLQCFAKLVLRAPKRAGRTHSKQLVADLSRRLRMFDASDLLTLWTEAQTAQQAPKVVHTRA